VAKSRLLLGALSACVAASAFQAPAVALPQEPAAQVDAAARARDRATNQALLAALRQRRAEVAQMPNANNSDALAFLDRQIDRVTNQALLDALLERRALVVRTTPDNEHRRYALEFLDRQIESVRRDLGD
jgi:hypothetical protein